VCKCTESEIKEHEEDIKKMKETDKTFTIKCTMKDRWVPHFLAMLKYMAYLGRIGSSRQVTLYSDGDGDFHPKFEWDESLPADAKPIIDRGGDRTYDAG
jgi:hypothetical protein